VALAHAVASEDELDALLDAERLTRGS